ncbi:hypothetical protein M3Y98_00672000 [Aphelenchoides besseyi]|nr:hypothetical protein M3Y98_00672000 [Aphelenchoides besseyi]KAI6208894.1 hypothetical protein M3Y96_00163300 [Aphelenchoides besseyi]KAI6209164.1 hypothetical protein M3Y96_00192300 [Aphelenchoides besseyi]
MRRSTSKSNVTTEPTSSTVDPDDENVLMDDRKKKKKKPPLLRAIFPTSRKKSRKQRSIYARLPTALQDDGEEVKVREPHEPTPSDDQKASLRFRFVAPKVSRFYAYFHDDETAFDANEPRGSRESEFLGLTPRTRWHDSVSPIEGYSSFLNQKPLSMMIELPDHDPCTFSAAFGRLQKFTPKELVAKPVQMLPNRMKIGLKKSTKLTPSVRSQRLQEDRTQSSEEEKKDDAQRKSSAIRLDVQPMSKKEMSERMSELEKYFRF